METLKINFIALSSKVPGKFGGIQTGPTGLVNQLRLDGHEVEVNGSGHYDIVDVHFGFNIKQLLKLNQTTPTAVHVHSVPQDMYGGILGFKWMNWLATPWLRTFYNTAQHLIPVSQFAYDCTRSIGVNTPGSVIGNGVNLDKFKPNTEIRSVKKEDLIKKYRLQSNYIVGCIGSIFPRKGIFDAIRLAASLPEMDFVWVGNYQLTYPKAIMKARLRNLPENFHFIGYIDDVLDFYYGIDVLLVPSMMETQGIPILEAAATDTLIIAREIPVYDWLQDNQNSLLFNSLQQARKKLLTSIEFDSKEIRNQASHDVQDHSVKLMAKMLTNTYRNVMDQFNTRN